MLAISLECKPSSFNFFHSEIENISSDLHEWMCFMFGIPPDLKEWNMRVWWCDSQKLTLTKRTSTIQRTKDTQRAVSMDVPGIVK